MAIYRQLTTRDLRICRRGRHIPSHRARDSHAPALAGKSSGLSNVGEFEAGVLVIERDQRISALTKVFDGRAFHDNNVELAVVVAVDQPKASAHGFDNVLLVARRDMGNIEADLFGDIFETGKHSNRLRRSGLPKHQ
jgi:hypothetical protein